MNKVVFYLMNEKGLHVLHDFLGVHSSPRIKYVVLSVDKNVVNDYFKEIKLLCEEHSIKYYRRTEAIPSFEGYKIAVGWRWIIPDQEKLIVLHDSLLPKYRGFAPLVNMLINGERELGVTALFASNQYDCGEIIKQESIPIDYPLRVQDAISAIAPLYSRLVNQVCESIFHAQPINGVPQIEDEATYSLWRDNEDYFINWEEDSVIIRRRVDALGYPYNGARTFLNNEVIILDEVEEYPDVTIVNRDIGKVIFGEQSCPVVVCGKGLLRIIQARYLNGESVLPLPRFRSRFGQRKNDLI